MSENQKTRQRADKKAIITVLTQDNPKRKNTLAYTRFALYRTGMSVADYVAAGGRTGDVLYDVAEGYISLATA